MRKWCMVSVCCFICSFILFMIAGLNGDVSVGFVLFFPYISGSGMWAVVGILFFILSGFSFFGGCMIHQSWPTDYGSNDISFKKNPVKESDAYNMKSRGIIFIGPIPLLFGFKKKKEMMIGLFFLMIVVYFLLYFFLTVL